MHIVTNIVFAAYYIAFAFKQRDACSHTITKEGGIQETINVSSTFNVSFVAGFVLHLINFTVCTFIEPCVRVV